MTSVASQPHTTKASSARQVRTVLLTAVAYFMVTLDALVVVTALPSIHKSFGGGIATLQWTVSAYTIAFGAGILTAAALGDRLGSPPRLRSRSRLSSRPPRPPVRSLPMRTFSSRSAPSRGWGLPP